MTENTKPLGTKNAIGKLSQQPLITSVANSTDDKVEKTKITLSITQEDCLAVKMYALKQHTTVSELLHAWIILHCETELSK